MSPVDSRPTLPELFGQFAHLVAQRGTCQRLQVGAVITSGDYMRVLAIGYNGNARGFPNTCDRSEQGNCGCLVSGTPVSAVGVQLAYRRWYEGEVVRVVTREGDFTVTPQHPILSLGHGWSSPQTLTKGDQLVHARRHENVLARAPHDYQSIPIEQVFDAVSVAGTKVRCAGAGHQFHSDGCTNQDVDIVSTSRMLRLAGEPSKAQFFDQPLLSATKKGASFGSGQRTLGGTVTTGCGPRTFGRSSLSVENASFNQTQFYSGAANSVALGQCVCGNTARVLTDDLLGREDDSSFLFVPAQTIGDASKSGFLSQALLNGRMAHPKVVCDSYDRFAAAVSIDDVIHVERYSWSGHVYNLQTQSGWYLCGNASTVVKNCIHAEINALLKLDYTEPVKVAFLTDSPCSACAKALVNAGVERVYYLRAYRRPEGLDILKQAHIPADLVVVQ